MKCYYVYMMANWNNNVLYVGVTDDLDRRDWEHKLKTMPGFTEKYNANKLVYFEEIANASMASAREKQLKKWRREKKNFLVNSMNPAWQDLTAHKLACDADGYSSSLGYARDVSV